MSPEVCVLYGESLAEYSFPDPHPFGRGRLPAFWEEFRRRGLDRKVSIEAPAMCEQDELSLFHTREYIGFVQQRSRAGSGFLDYGDTPAFSGAFEAASRVVGTTLKAVRLVMERRYLRAFSPMGGLHHARRNSAEGFCIFNDIGVAIEKLRRAYGIRRIAYVDIDAHHGDGVYYAFESDPEVFIADIHEDGRYLFPGTGSADETGKGPARGTKMNFPMPVGASDRDFFEAFEKIERFVDGCRPEIILFQCGADSVRGCPIAELRFSPACHATAARILRGLADRHANGRMIALGGGGYEYWNIATAWCGVVEALAEPAVSVRARAG